MELWLLLILVIALQGYCLGVQKNETRPSGYTLPPTESTSSLPSISFGAINGEIRSSHESGFEQVISTSPSHTTSTSNPRNTSIRITTASHATTSHIPKSNTATIKVKGKPTLAEDTPSSEFTVQTEVKIGFPLSDPVTTPMILNSTQKPLVLTAVHRVTEKTVSNRGNYENHHLSRKTTLPNANSTKAIQTQISRPKNHLSSEETSEEPGASTSAATESATELATLTPEETSTEEGTSTPTFTDEAEWSYSETEETTTDSTSENNFSYTTTDISTYPTTTDLTTEQKPENPATEGLSIPNGIALHENQPIRGASSPLAKLILRLSKPGVFEKGRSVFEDDASTITTSCPPGDVGLSCRRAEARKGADECSGGNCEVCRSCNNMAAIDWPHCCRENFRCCSELALACQQCDQPTLQVFCTKHFKRCF